MPFNKLDDVCALVAIDLQKGLAGMQTVHPFSGIVDRTAELAREFRARSLPVVLVNVSGSAPGRTDAPQPKFSFPPDWTDLLPALEHQATDHTVTKERWGAFHGTDLHDYLRGRGVTQIVLAGVATSIGVESSARSAYDLGYNVALVVDAMTDRDAEAHRHSVEKLFPRLGETGTANDVLNHLRAR